VIKLVYLARLREAFGLPGEAIELPESVTDVGALVENLRRRGAPWSTELAPGRALRVAVNQEMAKPSTPIGQGDEVAFFPPVTGG
jgi:molybdopterin synthase sulfur carrier subunit